VRSYRLLPVVVMANTSLKPPASVTALIERIVPAGDRVAQPGAMEFSPDSDPSVPTTNTGAGGP
jgi:hypothetical protein